MEAFCAVAQQVGASDNFLNFADSCTISYALGAEALTQPFVLNGLNAELAGLNQSLLTGRGGLFHAIGQLHLKQENYSQALTYYEQALPMLQEAGSSLEGATLGDMGIIYFLQGQHDKAVAFLQKGVEISRALDHRVNEEDALYFLAIAYWQKGDVASALRTLSQRYQVETENLASNLAIGSEERKREYIVGQTNSTAMTVSFYLQATPQSSEAARLALATVLQRKGRVLDAVSDNMQRLRQNLQPDDQKLLDDLNTFRAELVTLFYDKQNTLSVEEFKTQVAKLKAKIDGLENTLAQRSTKFRSEVQPITIEAVQALIPANAALIEFVRYSPFNPKANPITSEVWGIPHYAAVVLTPQGEPKLIDLGEAEPIDQLVEKFRESLRSQSPRVQEIGRELDAKLMQPIRPLLGNSNHVLISPDSQLNLIPFAALVDEQNRYLIDNYTFTYLTSGRDLLKLQIDSPSRQSPVLFANPDYDRPGNTEVAQIASANANPSNQRGSETQRSIDLSSLEFDPLDGTQREADAIAPLLPNVTVLTKSQASENALKQLQAPSILHIATHGFFLQDVECVPTTDTRGSNATIDIIHTGESNCRPTPSNTENPLLRSGLALAGFNPRQSGSEDGVLTALEVAGLDLQGTRLVVMSACETGLGAVANGEGVYGLRRAFVMAGAESQLMSLWKVDDYGTSELMSLYYKRLQQEVGRSEALRQVQQEMRQNPDYARYSHPYYWAGFIFSGDWSPIDQF